jgi:O-antigen/teichoic acid export membrane protein
LQTPFVYKCVRSLIAFVAISRNSTFVHSVAAIASGQAIATSIPILAAPILGRLYGPSETGLLGTYMSVASVFGAIACWQYSQAIIVEKCDNKAATLFHAGVVVTFLSTTAAAIFGVSMMAFSNSFGASKVAFWFLALPLSTFLAGYSSCQAAVANRQEEFKKIAAVLFIPTLISTLLSIGLGFAGWGVHGLFAAYFSVQVSTFLMYLLLVPSMRGRPGTRSMARIKAMLRRHRRFALFTTPTSFVQSFTSGAPIFALTALGDQISVGLFQRANQLLSMPSVLLGNSIAQVFQRRAAKQLQATGTCWPLYRNTLSTLFVIGALPTVALGFFAPSLFTWFLGPKWTEAGYIARFLAPTLLLRIVCSPLSTIFYIKERQREDLVLSIGSSFLTVLFVIGGFCIWNSPGTIVICYSIGLGLTYLVYILRSARLCTLA